MTTTYVKHPVTGGAAEVARLVLTDRNGTPKEVSALWKDGVCLFAKKGALVKNGNEMEDIDGNDVMAWSLPSDTPIPRHTYPWESEIIPLHDDNRWYVIVPDSVVVTMGGVDITASCYDAETHKISIPMVKGDIVVEAEATEVIQFEDNAVKAICVENFAKGLDGESTPLVENEITAKEAAEVTSLNNAFYSNTTITKFNELRYFTGLTSLYSKTETGYAGGQFYNCTHLTEVTLPHAENITTLGGAFRYCVRLTNVDISPLGKDGINIGTAFRDCRAAEWIKIPGVKYGGSWIHSFLNNGKVNSYTKLTTIIIDGTADVSALSYNDNPFGGTFGYLFKLTTITGTIVGIKYSMDLHWSPLIIESAKMILAGLDTPASGATRKITLKADMQATYEEDTEFNTLVSAAISKGWEIAYA